MKVQVLPSRQNIMNSKRIGNIGEAITLAKFVEKGIGVYVPFGDNEKIDLIIELNKLSKNILERYKDIEGEKALPVISNQKMNDYGNKTIPKINVSFSRKKELFKLGGESTDDSTIDVCTCYADHCNGNSASSSFPVSFVSIMVLSSWILLFF